MEGEQRKITLGVKRREKRRRDDTSRVKEAGRNSSNWQPRSRFNLSLRNGGERGCDASNAVASCRVMSLIGRNRNYIPVFANYRLLPKLCIQVFRLRDLIGRGWGIKERESRTDRSRRVRTSGKEAMVAYDASVIIVG